MVLNKNCSHVPSALPPLHCPLQAVVRTLQETTSAVAKMSSPSSSRASRSTDEAAQEEEVSTEWLESLHVRKKELQEKRQSRQLKRQEMSQRRSAASHKRMMIISQLADNTATRECCNEGVLLNLCDDGGELLMVDWCCWWNVVRIYLSMMIHSS